MRSLIAGAVFLAAVTAAPTTAAQSEDAVARSRAGEIECYTPNTAAKTCRAMSTYRRLADGRIMNDAIVLVQNHPHVVMYVSSNVVFRDGMVCGKVERADLEAATFEVDGGRATPAQARALIAAIAEQFAGMGEICSLYARQGDAFAVTAFVGGVQRPELTDQMIWVRREDGYTIGAVDAAPT